jgi:hypothetical protein
MWERAGSSVKSLPPVSFINLGNQLPTNYRGREFVDLGGNVSTQRTEGQHTSQRYERCGNRVL